MTRPSSKFLRPFSQVEKPYLTLFRGHTLPAWSGVTVVFFYILYFQYSSDKSLVSKYTGRYLFDERSNWSLIQLQTRENRYDLRKIR